MQKKPYNTVGDVLFIALSWLIAFALLYQVYVKIAARLQHL